ncbi:MULTISPECIES: IclR family transcriptional regulator [Methylobacterium]|jgi:DNA-binding IclR family transcriptional regulator|uniref:IclR family transcriptional regulator n=1 Tax=Methylobacterium TaxID=407 RepID=UPI0008EA3A81|nr:MULTISPECIES: IclR family transcriptional regulator [Methylobacterium]MBZ6412036.1 IclR family transcriptional regulator [Methylobacterium sp.]SFF14140.1 transcriptional regulator, IclR family [Methylobacterium sp. yr596]
MAQAMAARAGTITRGATKDDAKEAPRREALAQEVLAQEVLAHEVLAPKAVAAKPSPRDEAAEPEDGDRQFVTALARGLQVLRVFRDAAEMLGNREIAARTGLPKPTVSRLTHTLLSLGYLVHDPEGERYGLGPAVLALSSAFLRQNSFPQMVKPFLQDLATAVQAHVALGLLDGLSSVYVQLWRGEGQRIVLSSEVGYRLPLARSAMGMATLSSLEEAERTALMTRLRRDGADAARLDDTYRRCAGEIAERGFCVGIGIWHQDINAVAAPIQAPGGRGHFALNISGPAFLLTEAVLREDTGPRLMETIGRMRALGIVD